MALPTAWTEKTPSQLTLYVFDPATVSFSSGGKAVVTVQVSKIDGDWVFGDITTQLGQPVTVKGQWICLSSFEGYWTAA